MKEKFILAVDQGTSSSRAILFRRDLSIAGVAQREFRQIYPKAGWVEHDPHDILRSQLDSIHELLSKSAVVPSQIVSIGITNQRETTVLWDRKTGEPVYNAIVWQDKRTSEYCQHLINVGLQPAVTESTGLVIDAYFSAPKIKWILDHVPGLRARAAKGELAFGTVDAWLLWNLTGGRVHATDFSNASRTMIFNIRKREWDNYLMQEFSVPASILPEVRATAGDFGTFRIGEKEIPINSVAGDQQSALFGQLCLEPGMAKNTYGTGCFMLMNTGAEIHTSQHGLINTIAWHLNGKTTYALEGSVFNAGSAIQWLRDELRLIDESRDSEYLAQKCPHSNGVYVVPAFSGLGAPYWDMFARGGIFGLTRDTGKNEIVKATLESIAYQTRDILSAMESDCGMPLATLRVDGGATANNYLMQFQADLLGIPVERPKSIESTATGVAILSGLESGFWSLNEVRQYLKTDRIFEPRMDPDERESRYDGWRRAVSRLEGWEHQTTKQSPIHPI